MTFSGYYLWRRTRPQASLSVPFNVKEGSAATIAHNGESNTAEDESATVAGELVFP